MVPELGPLSEHRADMICQLLAFLPGDIAQDLCLSARRVQDAGQHFNGRRLTRAVRTDEAQQLACFHLKGELPDGFDGAIFRLVQGAQRARHPRSLALGLERFMEVGYFDGGHSL